jgi:hypothetical protein
VIARAVALLVVVLLAGETAVIWVDQLQRARAEAAYWRQRDNRPPLADWERDGWA